MIRSKTNILALGLALSANLFCPLLVRAENADGGASGVKSLELWKSFSNKAVQNLHENKQADAESNFKKALAAVRAYGDDTSEEVATLARLADLRLQQRDGLQAEKYLASIMKVYQLRQTRKKTKLSDDAVDWLDNLSYSFKEYHVANPASEKRGRYLLYSLKLKEISGSDKNIVEILRDLTLHSFAASKFVEAEKYCTRLIDRDQEINGSHNSKLAEEFRTLAMIKHRLNKYREAESYYRQAIALFSSLKGVDPSEAPSVQSELARCLLDAGVLDLARSEAEASLAVLERDEGKSDLKTVFPRRVLAEVAMKQKKYREAAPLLELDIKIIDACYGTNQPLNLNEMKLLIKAYKGLGRFKEAAELSRKVAYIESLTKGKG
ncbi:tetratricopeptide repeat protein [bacterium]|nr:tetratricopeptide repeat protein [bacterium]